MPIISHVKGITRPFELKEIYPFYMIDAGEFSYSIDMHQTTISGYLEINSIFNFDKRVLGYVKTVMDSQALPISF